MILRSSSYGKKTGSCLGDLKTNCFECSGGVAWCHQFCRISVPRAVQEAQLQPSKLLTQLFASGNPQQLYRNQTKKANQVNRERKHFCFKWYVGIWVGERQWNCSAGIWLAPCRWLASIWHWLMCLSAFQMLPSIYSDSFTSWERRARQN